MALAEQPRRRPVAEAETRRQQAVLELGDGKCAEPEERRQLEQFPPAQAPEFSTVHLWLHGCSPG